MKYLFILFLSVFVVLVNSYPQVLSVGDDEEYYDEEVILDDDFVIIGDFGHVPNCGDAVDAGTGSDSLIRYYYDSGSDRCKSFAYTGEGGSQNRFTTESECLSTCEGYVQPGCFRKERDLSTCRAEAGTSDGGICVNSRNEKDQCFECCCVDEPIPQSVCGEAENRGFGRADLLRWRFDQETGTCVEFSYGGSAGSKNNFPCKELCLQTCQAPEGRSGSLVVSGNSTAEVDEEDDELILDDDVVVIGEDEIVPDCGAPNERGNGSDAFVRFYYNMESDNCKSFFYTGDGGSDNRFYTEAECLSTCEGYVQPGCYRKERDLDTCKAETGTAAGGVCVNSRNEEDQCYECCCVDEPVPKSACDEEEDRGLGRSDILRWRFDKETGTCVEFSYGGSAGSKNNFPCKELCLQTCQPSP